MSWEATNLARAFKIETTVFLEVSATVDNPLINGFSSLILSNLSASAANLCNSSFTTTFSAFPSIVGCCPGWALNDSSEGTNSRLESWGKIICFLKNLRAPESAKLRFAVGGPRALWRRLESSPESIKTVSSNLPNNLGFSISTAFDPPSINLVLPNTPMP